MINDQQYQLTLNRLTSDGKQSFSLREVCVATGLCRATIWNFISNGKLTAVCFGRRVTIPAHELARLIVEGV